MTRTELEALLISIGCEGVNSSNSYVRACCPLHNESRPSSGVNYTETNHPWNCFVCGGGSSIVSLVSRVLDCDRNSAEKHILEFGSFSVPELDAQDILSGDFHKKEVLKFDAYFLSFYKTGFMAWTYHGLPSSVCKKAGILYEPSSKRFIIPWRNEGDIIGVTSHARPGSKVRSKMVPLFDFNHKAHLYFVDEGEVRKSEEVIVVEGPADALRVYSYGFKSVVALAGSSMTEKQASIIRSIGFDRVILMLDPDKAGLKGVKSSSYLLREKAVFHASLPDGRDPANCTKTEVLHAVNCAKYVLN